MLLEWWDIRTRNSVPQLWFDPDGLLPSPGFPIHQSWFEEPGLGTLAISWGVEWWLDHKINVYVCNMAWTCAFFHLPWVVFCGLSVINDLKQTTNLCFCLKNVKWTGIHSYFTILWLCDFSFNCSFKYHSFYHCRTINTLTLKSIHTLCLKTYTREYVMKNKVYTILSVRWLSVRNYFLWLYVLCCQNFTILVLTRILLTRILSTLKCPFFGYTLTGKETKQQSYHWWKTIYYIQPNSHKRSSGMTVGARNFKFCRKVAHWKLINENSSKWENVVMVTSKFENADFVAPFDPEDMRICHLYPSKLE